MNALAHPRALIADDEPLLRERLAAGLAQHWPQLELVAQARHGAEALEAFERELPDVVFLDVHMPGMDGVSVARAIGDRALVVFVTAYERYAVAAFEAGAVDYLLKPFEESRWRVCLDRVRERLAQRSARVLGGMAGGSAGGLAGGVAGSASGAAPGSAPGAVSAGLTEEQLDLLARAVGAVGQRAVGAAPARPATLQWIRASVGHAIKLIPVDEVAYLKSDEKYTLVAWAGGEALIRKTIRELIDELDPELFVQVHRSAIVNLRHVAQVVRGPNETADVHLRGRPEVLPVSRSCLHRFRQM